MEIIIGYFFITLALIFWMVNWLWDERKLYNWFYFPIIVACVFWVIAFPLMYFLLRKRRTKCQK